MLVKGFPFKKYTSLYIRSSLTTNSVQKGLRTKHITMRDCHRDERMCTVVPLFHGVYISRTSLIQWMPETTDGTKFVFFLYIPMTNL